jgi:hypothetical protein
MSNPLRHAGDDDPSEVSSTSPAEEDLPFDWWATARELWFLISERVVSELMRLGSAADIKRTRCNYLVKESNRLFNPHPSKELKYAFE